MDHHRLFGSGSQPSYYSVADPTRSIADKHAGSATKRSFIARHDSLPTPPPSTRPSFEDVPPAPLPSNLPTPSSHARPSLDTQIAIATVSESGDASTKAQHIITEIEKFRDGAADTAGRFSFNNVPNNIADILEEHFPDARLRLTHRIDTRTLVVRRRPTEVHESVSTYFSSLESGLGEWVRTHSPDICMDAIGSATQDLCDGGKKEPDQSFCVSTAADLNTPPPTVIVETGYSETYADLRKDVDDWLLQGKPGIRCVIIVWFTPPTSSADRWDASKWIGQLEVYERSTDSGKVSLYGERICFLPRPVTVPRIRLHIRHFLPGDLIMPESDDEVEFSLTALIEKVTRCLKFTLQRKRQRETDGEKKSKRTKIVGDSE